MKPAGGSPAAAKNAGVNPPRAELTKKGFALSDGPTKTGSGSTIAFIDAPEGYEVELIERGK